MEKALTTKQAQTALTDAPCDKAAASLDRFMSNLLEEVPAEGSCFAVPLARVDEVVHSAVTSGAQMLIGSGCNVR